MEYEPTDPETKKIWFLDYIRGRIGHEFTMEEVTTRGSLVWLCDDPSILSNSREYNVVKLKAYFIMTTFYIDELVEKLKKQVSHYECRPQALCRSDGRMRSLWSERLLSRFIYSRKFLTHFEFATYVHKFVRSRIEHLTETKSRL